MIAIIQESDTALLDALLAPYHANIVRYDAAEIADEIENAANIQYEMQKTLRKQLREEKSSQRKEKIAQKKEKKYGGNYQGVSGRSSCNEVYRKEVS